MLTVHTRFAHLKSQNVHVHVHVLTQMYSLNTTAPYTTGAQQEKGESDTMHPK